MNYAEERDIKKIVINALKEDIDTRDITTEAVIPDDKSVSGVLLAKEKCVVCGLGAASLVFKLQDKNIKFKPLVREGSFIKDGTILAKISGKARGILTAERVVLNFLSFLSGIATQTRKFVKAVKPYKAKILDTRKTIPGLRILEKYAVRIGGGFNHRLSLDEMMLIKDNHLAALGVGRYALCVKKIIEKIKKKKPKNIKIEIEVKNLSEFKEALKAKPDIIMLDNMKIADIKKAVLIKRTAQNAQRRTHSAERTTLLEASGGITLKNVKKIASTGIEMISVGALTHSVDSVDISLEIV